MATAEAAAARRQQITDTVNRYLELVAAGDPDGLVALYADDATVEDPVGGDVHIGPESIRRFYSALQAGEATTELVTLRVAGNEAAFLFRLTMQAGENRISIEPIDVMAFTEDGKIAAMKAYWSPENVVAL